MHMLYLSKYIKIYIGLINILIMNEQLIADNIFFNSFYLTNLTGKRDINSNVVYCCQNDKKRKRVYNKVRKKLKEYNAEFKSTTRIPPVEYCSFCKPDSTYLIEILNSNTKIHFISENGTPCYINPSLIIFDGISVDLFNSIFPHASSNSHIIFINDNLSKYIK